MLVNFLKTNPVRAMAIVNALIVFAAAFGAHLTTEQIAAITALAGVILGLGGELVRSQVTPLATLPDHVAAAVNAQADADVPKRAALVPAATEVPSAVPIVNTLNMIQPSQVLAPAPDGVSNPIIRIQKEQK